jgi:formamidopyrimidine-DNA glycosylase
MPEIAEVAVYAYDINRIVKNSVLKKISFQGEKRWQPVIVPKTVVDLLHSWVGQSLHFSSLAKTLYLQNVSDSNKIQFKLGMTGMFQIKKIQRHGFLVFEFEFKDQKPVTLYYLDYRRFGRVALAKHELLAIAGYSSETGFYVKARQQITEITQSLRGIKTKPRITWLLEHGSKTGVGNYLANEALGQLNLSPFLPCVNEKEAVDLLVQVGRIAKKSFQHGGNSFKGGYYRLTGELGDFFKFCKFYRNTELNHYTFRGRPIFTKFKLPRTSVNSKK